MRSAVLWTLWALLPVAMLGFHLGYGRELRKADGAHHELRTAASLERAEDWAGAAAAYERALAVLRGSAAAKDENSLVRVELAAARAQMYAGDLVAGQERAEKLLTDSMDDPALDQEVKSLVRVEVARAGYHTAWAMRLEGGSQEEWIAESGKARAMYRLLAEEAERAGSAGAEQHREDLEAVIRFERMTLDELRAMGLPKACQNCKSGVCKQKRQQKQSQSPGKGEPKDAREKVNQAGTGVRSGKGW